MSFESEMTTLLTTEVLVRLTNPGNADATSVNSSKIAQVLKFVIGDFYRVSGVAVTEDDITDTNLYLEPALNRGLFYLQKYGGKIGPPQDDKATLEEIRKVTNADRIVPEVGTFEGDSGVFSQEEDPYFPDSFLQRKGFPPKPERDEYGSSY
jgi:hypothetical protein